MLTFQEILPDPLIIQILSHVSSEDLLQLRMASRSMNDMITSSQSEVMTAIWREKLIQDFNFERTRELPNNPNHMLTSLRIRERRQRGDGVSIFGYHFSDQDAIFTANSHFESWKHYTKASAIFYHCHEKDDTLESRGINGPYFLRAARMWQHIGEFCGRNDVFGENLMASFEPGVDHNNGRFHECKNKKFAHALEAVFAFSDGQHMPDSKETVAVGFFGGFAAYNFAQISGLYPTAYALKYKSTIPRGSILIGGEYLHSMCGYALRLVDGALFSFHPSRAIRSAFNNDDSTRDDTGLLWLEEYVRRIVHGEVEVLTGKRDDFLFDNTWTYLSQFPTQKSPYSSRTVTKGIEVIASSLAGHQINTVVYSIRIRMLARGEEGYLSPQERGFDTCQLSSRHWKLVNAKTNGIDEVNGEGVVGRFPILIEDGYIEDEDQEGGVFIYQSCSGAALREGTFEGKIKFIPGTIKNPTGPGFYVEVGRFPLSMSPSIYY